MSRISRLTAQDREDFVAYVDGELDDARAREVERTLSENPVARNDVELLTRTWDLVDLLPRVEASPDFTQKTLEIVQLEKPRREMHEQPWFQQARRGIVLTVWAAGILLAAGIGFWVTREAVPDPVQPIVDDLPLLERLDDYRDAGGVDFLQKLQNSGVFNDEPEAETP